MESPHLNKTVTTDEERPDDNYNFSQPTTILLTLVVIYIICTAIWFIHSRYCSANRKGPTFLSALRQRLALWKGSLFRNNRNSHYNYDNLPSHYDLDEREYKSWSVTDVASWSRSKLAVTQLQSNGNHHYNNSPYFRRNNTSTTQYHESNHEYDMIIQQAIYALMQQQIDGASLDYITLEYLSRWMPFGTAVRLMSQYDALITTYSSQEGNNQENNTGWLSEDLPSWYSDNQLHQERNNHHDVEAPDALNSEHVQRLMKDRFGLTLPALRTEEKLPSDTKVASALEMTSRATPIRVTQTKKPAVNNSTNLDDILKSMPPHIRAVAERRSDLVADLLASRQQQQQPLIPIHEEHLTGESEEEADLDSESASLLRRRLR